MMIVKDDLSVSELHAIERMVESAVNALKRNCVKAVAEAPTMDGVSTLPSSPRCCVVSASAMFAAQNYSPSYFHQESQAEVVCRVLDPAYKSIQIEEKLREMIENKCARIGGVKYPLNPSTIDVLRTCLR